MKYFQELVDTDLNNDIIYDNIYGGKTVKQITDRAMHITAANYHKSNLEKVADAYNHIDKEEHNKLYLLLNKYELLL